MTNGSKEKKKTKLNRLNIARFFLIVMVILFAVSLWFYTHPLTHVTHTIEPVETEVPVEDVVVPTPLPSYLKDPESLSVIVNADHPLSADYEPHDLTRAYGSTAGDALQISTKIEEDLKYLLTAALDEGIEIYITAGYISYQTQQDYYNAQVKLVGEKEAEKTVAKAGYSEHQTGFAVDFSDTGSGENPRSLSFAETETYKWLSEHAWEYGFILRYPKGKESITKNNFEPWHFRYVGIETAEKMHETDADLTMEEYFGLSS